MRIDKRIPFGFLGEWGKVYKLYNSDEVVNGAIKWQESNYADIGQEVQFKCAGNRKKTETTPTKNLVALSEGRTVETSDAWFNGHEYKCVVEVGDVIELQNDWWVAEQIIPEEIYTPAEHTIWAVVLKKINDKIVKGE